MSTYTQILYQIVLSTKRRERTLTKDNRTELFKYMWCVLKEKNRLIEYVKNQEEHHKTTTFREELIELLKEHGVEFDEKYLD